MPKVDRDAAPRTERQAYPGRLLHRTDGCWKTRLGDQIGLTQMGIGEVELAPGSATGLLHYHLAEDEFIYVLAGEVTLVEEGAPDIVLGPGDSAGWRAGEPIGHSIENRSDAPARLLEIGPRMAVHDTAYYIGHDLIYRRTERNIAITRRNGIPYAAGEEPGPFDDGDPKDR